MSKNCELDLTSLEGVSGGMRNLANSPAYHGIRISKDPGTVGQGDTIDGIPWGGTSGDGSWGTFNGNLPGAGNWGN